MAISIVQITKSPSTKALHNATKKMKKNGYKLRSYQRKGVRWMIKQERDNEYCGGILADDPGLGKTIQTVALMVALKKKTLIIVPTSVIKQWAYIVEKLFTKKKVYIHYGPKKEKTSKAIKERLFDVCITSHGTSISQKKEVYKTVLHINEFWERVIIDEGHVIRNSKTKMYKTALNYSNICQATWLLSGTPIQNKKTDIINLLTFIGISKHKLKQNLEKYILEYLLRRTKKVLLDKTFTECDFRTHLIPFRTQEEQNIYFSIETFIIDEILDLKYSGVSAFEYDAALLEKIIRLRQASSHPEIALCAIRRKYIETDANFDAFSGPSTKIAHIVEDIQRSVGLSLVFCHFNAEIEILKKELYDIEIKAEVYQGGMSQKNRTKTLEKFRTNRVEAKVLIVQITAGGVGLNLQEFSNVFILGPDWNPSNEFQAISRAHRFGQKKLVKVHKYILTFNPVFYDAPEYCGEIDSDSTTIDQRIMVRQIEKRELMANLLHDETLRFSEKLFLVKDRRECHESMVSDYDL